MTSGRSETIGDRSSGEGNWLSGGSGFGDGDRKVFRFSSHHLEQSGHV
jgi:hypothetical protein